MNKTILLFSSLILFFSLGLIGTSYAIPYDWTTSPINLSWTSTPSNMLAFDVDNDGNADSIYTYVYSGQNYTLTRILGNSGVFSPSVILNVTSNAIIRPDGNEVFFSGDSSTVSGKAYVSKVNIQNGTAKKYFGQISSGGGGALVTHGFMKDRWNKITMSIWDKTGGIAYLKIANSTNILYSSSVTCCYSDAEKAYSNYYYVGVHVNPTSITSMGQDYDNIHYSSCISVGNVFCPMDKPLKKWGNPYGMCSGTVCTDKNGNGTSTLQTNITFPTVFMDRSIKFYINGMNPLRMTENEFSFPSHKNLKSDYFPISPLNSTSQIGFLHYKILDPTLNTSVPFFFFKNATHNYIMYGSGSTIKYASLPSLANRAIENILIDKYTGSEFPTMLATAGLTTYAPFITSSSGTWSSVNTMGSFVLPSGYKVTPDATTTNRQIISSYTNTNSIYPVFLGITTGHTALSILIKNTPADYALIIKDVNLFNGLNYVWSIQPLTADKTVTVDLLTGLCVSITGVTTTAKIPEYNEFGTLCASGTMPKTLVYSSNLSFTFWSLPYGATHTFNNNNNILTTTVRHDTMPFNYTVKIYDATNVLKYTNQFKANSTLVDKQTINSTGISKPSQLKVYDINGNQIYYSTLGVPSYLSASVLWFNTWLTISGFNLLFMLPIVFGAMFTRNTVGIGTMTTVAFIATLSWFGIISIPDIALYLMIFIAVIGVIAYKKLYD